MMAWKSGGSTRLDLTDRNREWDNDTAEDKIFEWAGFNGDNPDPKKAQRAFFAFDDEKPENKTAYKLPFATVIDGELKAVPRAIFAVAQVLEGARGGVDLPQSVQKDVRKDVAKYYEKMGDQPPW